MKNKYILKGLFLSILIPSTMYYFFKTPGSEVTISSLFILILTVMTAYEKVILTSNKSVIMKPYQLVIDRTLVVLLIVVATDVLLPYSQ